MKRCSGMNCIVIVSLIVSSIGFTRVYSGNKNCPAGNRVIASVGECMPRYGNNIGPGSIVADAMLQETRHWKTQAALLDIFSIRKDLKPGRLTLSEAQRLVLDVPLWEIGNALSAMFKKNRISLRIAHAVLKGYLQIPIQIHEIDIVKAPEISKDLNIYAYDAYMIECARNLKAPLLTLGT